MPVAIIVPIDAVDEIRVFKDTVVVESFGVDAQSFLLLEYLGQGSVAILTLKAIFCWSTPSNTTTNYQCEESGSKGEDSEFGLILSGKVEERIDRFCSARGANIPEL